MSDTIGSQLSAVHQQCVQQIEVAESLSQLEDIRVGFLGKKGLLTQQLKQIGSLVPAERPKFGERVNRLKADISQRLAEKHQQLELLQLQRELAQQRIDVSLPGRGVGSGGIHPVSRTMARIEKIFRQMGFAVATGPEIETDFHNFEALNIPAEHPARTMHDTFYVDQERLLRTHTSPVQIRYMLSNKPPISVIAPGRVYRCDSDVTHTPMFHQVEGLMVGVDVSFAHMKGILTHFLQQFFEAELSLRLRPSYFPFTEPSAEVDISCVFCESGCRICGHSGWIEVLGGGMVHPNVFAHVGIDSEKYTGFAFGLGVERLAMLRYDVDDLRLFFDNDLEFLEQLR